MKPTQCLSFIRKPKLKQCKNRTFRVIGPNVTVGDDCEFHSNVVVDGYTTIGKGNKFYLPALSVLHPKITLIKVSQLKQSLVITILSVNTFLFIVELLKQDKKRSLVQILIHGLLSHPH